MKTQYYTSSSLDGFLATEDDSLDWLFPLGDIDQTSYPAFIEGVGAIAMGVQNDMVPLWLAGVAILVASLIVGILGSRLLVVTRIGENYTRFRGAGSSFLETLPAFYRTR